MKRKRVNYEGHLVCLQIKEDNGSVNVPSEPLVMSLEWSLILIFKTEKRPRLIKRPESQRKFSLLFDVVPTTRMNLISPDCACDLIVLVVHCMWSPPSQRIFLFLSSNPTFHYLSLFLRSWYWFLPLASCAMIKFNKFSPLSKLFSPPRRDREINYLNCSKERKFFSPPFPPSWTK